MEMVRRKGSEGKGQLEDWDYGYRERGDGPGRGWARAGMGRVSWRIGTMVALMAQVKVAITFSLSVLAMGSTRIWVRVRVTLGSGSGVYTTLGKIWARILIVTLRS